MKVSRVQSGLQGAYRSKNVEDLPLGDWVEPGGRGDDLAQRGSHTGGRGTGPAQGTYKIKEKLRNLEVNLWF